MQTSVNGQTIIWKLWLHWQKNTDHFFTLKFCEHCCLENSKIATRIIEIWENLRKCFECFQLHKTFTKHEEKFDWMWRFLGLDTTKAIFLLTIINDIEPWLVLFQGERPFSFFFCKAKPNPWYSKILPKN